MARPLRIEYAGAYYHVMNRGNRRQVVFPEPRDYELFLERLGRFGAMFDVHVLCYCCLPNHFHLYLRTEQANLSRFMQSLLTSFTISLNRRHHSSGHIFQGRFTAHLIENEAYGAEVSRYVHLNPVRTKALRQASLPARRQALRSFPWSSYAACIGVAGGPPWFDPTELLSDWGASRRTRMRRYAEHVEEGLLRDLESPLARLEGQTILGTETFVDRMRRAYILTRTADRREQPVFERARQSLAFEAAAQCVSQVCGVEPDRLLARHGADRQARQLLIHAVCRYCRGSESLTALARRVDLSLSGLTMARTRIENRLRHDKPFSQIWAQVEQRLKDLCET
jgi:putative transposase